MSEKDFQVKVRQYKSGALSAEIQDANIVIKEVWQDFVLNPKLTAHLLKAQVEIFAWTDKI